MMVMRMKNDDCIFVDSSSSDAPYLLMDGRVIVMKRMLYQKKI